ncbi:MAG TPA: hypothetical protein VK918_03650, partial [Pyrinomonadaceae bacterium]|nr:hypothetical protein [Pyrinomonadaceae bacterium]
PFVLEAVKQRERNELARDLGDNAGEVFESIDNAADVGDEEQFYWFSKEFGGYLSLRSDLKGVIIFYADEQRYDIAKLTNHIDAAVSSFEQDGQRLEGRVDIVFGGYRSWPVAEFFIYPPGAVFPEPTPEEREIESSDLEY